MESGFLLLDKARGLRSTACVNALRKALGGRAKTGHAGTLDSTAEGLLILLFGRMTRASRYVMALPKTYEVTALFGFETDTLDAGGTVSAGSGNHDVPEKDLLQCLNAFLGWTAQVPPRVSAVRVKGKRAHEVARAGGDLALKPRPVYVSSIRLEEHDRENGRVKFTVTCGKGTYVRSIVRDMGRRLGTFATVSRLRRTAIGPFLGAHAVKLEALDMGGVDSCLREPAEVTGAFPCYMVPDDLADALENGNAMDPAKLERKHWGVHEDSGIVVLVGGSVISFARITASSGKTLFRPETNIFTGKGNKRDP